VSIVSLLVGVSLMRHRGVDAQELTAHASSTGQASFCINQVPSLGVPCNATASQNVSYSCQLNGTDANGHNITFSRQFVTAPEIFNVTVNGTINFTPTNDDVGNHTIVFSVEDNSGCPLNGTSLSFNLTVLNVNDPPYLVLPLPNQSFVTNTTLSAFFLRDYFADPDGDNLTFTSSVPGGISVTILATSEVRFGSAACVPSGEIVTFTATDPSSASAESNPVTVVVTCQPQSNSGSSNQQGGGGGGGGGANICTSEWVCQDWFSCLPTGWQWRRCYDKHACEDERFIKRQCEFQGTPPACEEDWLCSMWSVCYPNATQTRTCEDLNGCGSEVVRPAATQACVYIASCTDGIQNGEETGIDCGGLCPACALVQQPTFITAGGRLGAWLVLAIVLAILLVSGVLRYYKGEIAQALATLGFLLRHRAYKEILLTAPQRKMLFERIRAFEGATDRTAAETYAGLGMLVRSYMHEALGVPLEALPEEIAARCKALGLTSATSSLINGLAAKLAILEEEELDEDRMFVVATTEELRTLVCMTSDYQLDEISRQIEEIRIVETMSFYDELFARMTNVLRAAQFGQLELARREYVTMLSRYNGLSLREQEQIYPELTWVFSMTKLQSEITGAKVVRKRIVA
jgi:hypothetical protein